MQTIKVKDIIIGQGIPKIAVSIIGTSLEEIIESIGAIPREKVDIVEWRADFFRDIFSIEKVLDTLKLMRKKLIDMPLIFTFRTKEEGGEKEIDMEYYTLLNTAVASSGDVDLIDIQISLDEDIVKENIDKIHGEDIFVIGSNHDFLKTPKKEEMIDRLKTMDKLGADILKIAVMPKDTSDVLDLLSLTDEMRKTTQRPIITISMGRLGLISRISGETFGSSLTFGAIGKTSAPGQIPVEKLFQILHSIH